VAPVFAQIRLLHGTGGSRRHWAPVRPKLAGHHELIAVDLPGHGDSDPPPDHTPLGYAAALASAAALVTGCDLDAALHRYRRAHQRRLGPHHFFISDLASARPANPLERAMYRAAVTDDRVFYAFEAIGSRRRSPATLFMPRTLTRIARTTMTR
jgi:hypothetical protein